MCGIAGVIGKGFQEERAEALDRMCKAIVHRGPDDEGQWVGESVAFGMRRLSIIDLAGGHQPMWTDDGVGIVFNGEIYNYRALRAELQNDGYRFRTQSDTEVLLYLYHRDGLAAVRRLEGMFAICLYDSRQNVLHLVRDRLGVKPLYYGLFGVLFYFASEIKAILAGLDHKPPLNIEAFHHYLTLRYVPGPETIWQGIYKLEPGHALSIDLQTGAHRVECYWHVQFEAREQEDAYDYLKEFERLFLAAVEKRLLASDVPVGVLLSGGIDSSAVGAAAVELGHRDFHTFSVAFADGGAFDETPYARTVAKHIGSQHHEITIGQEDFLEFLPSLVHFTDEPLADLAAVPLYYVCRLARQHVKVVLSGEGSDEVLAGYDLERLAFRLEKIRVLDHLLPRPLIKLLARFSSMAVRTTFAALADSGWSGYLRARTSHMTYEWTEKEKQSLWRSLRGWPSSDALIRSWYELAGSRHPLDQLQQVYMHSWLVEDLLMKADKMSMATSLELRVPFLDHTLVEWAATLPHSWKVGDRTSGPVSKRILREFCRKRLPPIILTRPKQGFPVPAYQWLTGPMGAWAQELLCDPKSRVAERFNLSSILPVVAAARNGDQASARRVWVLIIAEQWLRHWL